MRHAPLPKTSQSVPLFQLFARGHPPSRDDVCAVPAQPSERRGSAIRAWDRHLPRDGEVLESYVTERRDKAAALAFLKKALKRHGRAETIVTDGMRSYQAAMRARQCRSS